MENVREQDGTLNGGDTEPLQETIGESLDSFLLSTEVDSGQNTKTTNQLTNQPSKQAAKDDTSCAKNTIKTGH